CKQSGGQPLTWKRSTKEITKRLGAVGATRLPGWGPRDPHCAWLETLQDMAANRCQWRSCSVKTAYKLHSGYIGATRIRGWAPRDPHCAWLETLQDMAANRCQWRSCC
ncbi:hypothetical protein T265_12586, partial [Opisthorchis viverrini]